VTDSTITDSNGTAASVQGEDAVEASKTNGLSPPEAFAHYLATLDDRARKKAVEDARMLGVALMDGNRPPLSGTVAEAVREFAEHLATLGDPDAWDARYAAAEERAEQVTAEAEAEDYSATSSST